MSKKKIPTVTSSLPLPDGWVAVDSRSRPGKISYKNKHTGERIAWPPTQPAATTEGDSFDIQSDTARRLGITQQSLVASLKKSRREMLLEVAEILKEMKEEEKAEATAKELVEGAMSDAAIRLSRKSQGEGGRRRRTKKRRKRRRRTKKRRKRRRRKKRSTCRRRRRKKR